MKTIPDRAILFTHKNSDFGAISVTERRASCAAPSKSGDSHIIGLVLTILDDFSCRREIKSYPIYREYSLKLSTEDYFHLGRP